MQPAHGETTHILRNGLPSGWQRSTDKRSEGLKTQRLDWDQTANIKESKENNYTKGPFDIPPTTPCMVTHARNLNTPFLTALSTHYFCGRTATYHTYTWDQNTRSESPLTLLGQPEGRHRTHRHPLPRLFICLFVCLSLSKLAVPVAPPPFRSVCFEAPLE